MVDPDTFTIAYAASTALASFYEVAVKQGGAAVARQTSAKASELVDWIKNKFGNRTEYRAVENYPDSQISINKLADVIAEHISSNDEDRNDLIGLIGGIQSGTTIQVATGERSMQFANNNIFGNIENK